MEILEKFRLDWDEPCRGLYPDLEAKMKKYEKIGSCKDKRKREEDYVRRVRDYQKN